MKTNLKRTLIALASAAAACAVVPTGASAFTLVTLVAPTAPGDTGPMVGSFSATASAGGSFTDDFVFVGPPPVSIDTFSATAGAGVSFGTITLSYFAGDTLPFTSSTLSSTAFAAESDGLIGATYDLKITGTATAGSTFTGTIDAYTNGTAPVPEPETYALLLAGLGVVGLVARGRKRQA